MRALRLDIKDTPQQFNLMRHYLLLAASYILNIGVWTSHFAMILKGSLAVVAGVTTLMAFMLTFKKFEREYGTSWPVVYIHHFYHFIKQKKRRHINKMISQPKKKKDETICD